jgi:acyl-CoA thioesterase FadM
VRTRIKHLRGPLIQFAYELYHEPTHTLLAEGDSTHIVVNSRFERTTLPSKYADAFERALTEQNGA